jgi:hypothetical protein
MEACEMLLKGVVDRVLFRRQPATVTRGDPRYLSLRRLRAEKFSRVYQVVDSMREKYGKHTVFLGPSYLAQKFGQHLGERGDELWRKQ